MMLIFAVLAVAVVDAGQQRQRRQLDHLIGHLLTGTHHHGRPTIIH